MPLEQSSSKEAISDNIATERKEGKSAAQSSAIAYSISRQGARDRVDHDSNKEE